MFQKLHPIMLLAIMAMLLPQALAQNAQAAAPFGEPNILFVPNWLSLAAVGLMLSVGIIAISYMAGEAFNYPNARSFARQETYELITSIIIILLVAGGIMAFRVFSQQVAGSTLVSKGVSPMVGYCDDSKNIYPVLGEAGAKNPENALYADVDWFLGCMPISKHGKYEKIETAVSLRYDPNQPSHWQAAEWKDGSSKGIMISNLMNIYISLFSLEFLIGPLSTIGVTSYVGEPSISSISGDLAPSAALSPISELLVTITDLTGYAIASLMMQKIFLQFIHINALPIFLPLGIAFRAIPLLRKTGSTLIAIALVMYFVYPITIWINQQVYFILQNPQRPMISSWANYNTLLQACVPQNEEERQNPKLIEQRVRELISKPYVQDAQKIDEMLRIEVFGKEKDASGNPIDVKLPISQQKAIIKSIKENGRLVLSYVLHPGSITGPVLPADFVYSMLVDEITVASQWLVLSVLFLLNSLIITITLFRDISMAIGGEPRIFGISKLV